MGNVYNGLRRTGDVYFQVMAHVAVLSTRETGWTKEVNIVAWNGNAPKVDIREWDPEHERMTRGITLFHEDGKKLIEILREKLPSEDEFPTETSDGDGADVTFKVISVLGCMSEANGIDWKKEVTITSWNGGAPKVDVRNWSPDHERMTRGISLTRDEATVLAGLDIDKIFEGIRKEAS